MLHYSPIVFLFFFFVYPKKFITLSFYLLFVALVFQPPFGNPLFKLYDHQPALAYLHLSKKKKVSFLAAILKRLFFFFLLNHTIIKSSLSFFFFFFFFFCSNIVVTALSYNTAVITVLLIPVFAQILWFSDDDWRKHLTGDIVTVYDTFQWWQWWWYLNWIVFKHIFLCSLSYFFLQTTTIDTWFSFSFFTDLLISTIFSSQTSFLPVQIRKNLDNL